MIVIDFSLILIYLLSILSFLPKSDSDKYAILLTGILLLLMSIITDIDTTIVAGMLIIAGSFANIKDEHGNKV